MIGIRRQPPQQAGEHREAVREQPLFAARQRLQNALGHPVGAAHLAHRRAGVGGGFAVEAEGVGFDRRGQKAGVHHQHADALVRHLAAQHFEELGQRRLGAAIAGAAQHRHPAGHGTDIDHAAAAGAQQRQTAQGERHRRLPVHRHDLAEHLHVGARRRRAVGDAGVVDQHVQPAAGGDRVDQAVPGRPVGELHGEVAHPVRILGGQLGVLLRQGVRVPVHQNHTVAARERRPGQGPAQAGRGAGNQRGGRGGHSCLLARAASTNRRNTCSEVFSGR